MRGREKALVDPLLRLDSFKGEDDAPVGTALRVPDRGVGEMRVIGDEGIGAVVVALRGVHRLRAAYLFRRLTEEKERACDAEPFHRRLRRQYPGERGRAERGVRIGVPSRPRMQPD